MLTLFILFNVLLVVIMILSIVDFFFYRNLNKKIDKGVFVLYDIKSNTDVHERVINE